MRARAAVLLFFLFWVVAPFWRIATLQAVNIQDDVYTSDLLNDRLPCRAFVGRTVSRWELPVWMPGVYTGFPALAGVEVGALYPSNLALFGFLDPWVAVAWAQLLPLLIAGLGAFALAREYEIPPPAALLTGGSFCLSGFFISHLRQLNMVDAACWIPLELLLVERMARGRGERSPSLLATVWALQLLAGHPQVSYITGLVLGVFLLARRARVMREGSGGGILRVLGDPVPRRFALAIVVGSAIAGAQLLPAIELSGLSHRSGGFTFEEAAAFPSAPQNFWTFFLPYINGDPGRLTYRLSRLFWEEYGYLGLAPVLLAAIAAVTRRRDPVVRLFGTIAIVSYLLVLGANTPLFYWAYSLVPGMSYFRFPTRFLVFVELAIALLAGFGLATVLGALRGLRRRTWVAAAVLAITAVDLWVHQMQQVPQVAWREWRKPISTVRYLRDQQSVSIDLWRYYSLDSTVVHRAAFAEARGWAGDLSPYVRVRAMLQPSFNLLYGLESPDGYVNLAPRYYDAVWGSDKTPGLVRPSGEMRDGFWKLRPEVTRILRLFNVRYVLSALPIRSAGLWPALRTEEGVAIYAVTDPLPRAFVVGEVVTASSDEEALDLLRSADFDPARRVIVHDPGLQLPDDSVASRNVRIIERGNRRLRLRINLEKPGLLVVSEGFYPGWRATIDDRPVPVHRANLMMRAVVAPSGRHEVVLEFRSWTVRAGFLVSFAGLLALVAMRGSLLRLPLFRRGPQKPV